HRGAAPAPLRPLLPGPRPPAPRHRGDGPRPVHLPRHPRAAPGAALVRERGPGARRDLLLRPPTPLPHAPPAGGPRRPAGGASSKRGRRLAHPMANRLADQASSYLRSAAHQPVHWMPWGPEAFERARAEDKPILLDVGAVWCHWCHVMDRESYEDPALAEVANRLFVPVKVDRDERPDVDARYQKAVQAMTGQGGWPLTAFLLPDGRVFYGGTYFPPRDAHGRPAFRRVL